MQKPLPQTDDTINFCPIHELAGRIELLPRFPGAPLSDSVEVFKRETDRVHHLMAARARRIRPMLFHALPHRLRSGGRIRLQRRNVRRRIGRMRTEKIFEDPFAAQYWRCPVRIRSDQLDASLSEQTAPDIEVAVELYSSEVASIDVRNAIVRRQALIDECVIAGKQLKR